MGYVIIASELGLAREDWIEISRVWGAPGFEKAQTTRPVHPADEKFTDWSSVGEFSNLCYFGSIEAFVDDINQRLHRDNIDYDDGGVRVKVQYVQQAKNSIKQYLVRLERPPDQGRKDCESKGYMTVTRRRDPTTGGGKPSERSLTSNVKPRIVNFPTPFYITKHQINSQTPSFSWCLRWH